MAARGSNRRDGPVENRGARLGGEDLDVLLDVPMLNVEELELEVDELRAHVSVRAELADFVNINVGVDAYLDKVKLGIKGVEAQVLLKVKLERILGTIERALDAIDRNPRILDARLSGEEDQTALEAMPEPEEGGEVEATDAARRKAAELGVEISAVEGTGSGGRVLVKDVQKAAR